MKFTIAIPAYKAAYLRECIESVLNQTFTDFELIIVNDASPENIDEIVNAYTSEKLTYYKNEKNFGAENVVDNWNKCLSYASGDFFVLLGDDDKMHPEYLEEFSRLINEFPKCNLYHCRSVIIDDRSIPIQLTEPRPAFESVYDSILARIKGHRHFFISDYVFRTEMLRKNGGFYKLPLAWASDDISAYIAAEEEGTAHTNKPVFMYRRNALTISSKGSVHIKMKAIFGEEQWLASFIEKQPKNELDLILRENIRRELKTFIQKKKILTIQGSYDNSILYFPRWFLQKKKNKISSTDVAYAWLMNFKEKIKKRDQ